MGELDERLAAMARQSPPVDVAGLWSGVQREVRAKGWRERLRSLPSGLRVTLALASAVVLVAVAMLVAGTREVHGGDTMRLVLLLTALALIATAAFAMSLRGLHRPTSRMSLWAIVALAVGLPFVLALTPEGGAEGHSSHWHCLVTGLVTGVLVSVPVFLMQRASVPVLARAAAAMAGGGAIAFGLLELHCTSRDVSHLLIGHALVGVLLVVASLVRGVRG